MSALDPRWEWIEVSLFGEREPRYVKGACNHLEVVAVEAALGLVLGDDGVRPIVAHLCLTCDAQLPAEWLP